MKQTEDEVIGLTSAMYKKTALGLLYGKWGLATVAMAIMLLVQVMITTQLELDATDPARYLFALMLFYVATTLLAPLELGRNWLFLEVAKGEHPKFSVLVENFGTLRLYGRSVLFYGLFYFLLNALALLFIIPGVVFYLTYRLTPFLLRDEGMSVFAAMKESRRLMKGHKRRLARLMVSFFLWYMFVLLSGGIGMLFVIPYFETALAVFFLELRSGQDVSQALNEEV